MAEARGRHDWGQTSLLACILFNANRGPGQKALGPEDFNPYTAGKVKEPDIVLDAKEGMAFLKKVFEKA